MGTCESGASIAHWLARSVGMDSTERQRGAFKPGKGRACAACMCAPRDACTRLCSSVPASVAASPPAPFTSRTRAGGANQIARLQADLGQHGLDGAQRVGEPAQTTRARAVDCGVCVHMCGKRAAG